MVWYNQLFGEDLNLGNNFGDDFGEDAKIGVSKVEPEVSPIGEVLEVVFRPKK